MPRQLQASRKRPSPLARDGKRPVTIPVSSPAPEALRAGLPEQQAPQLATLSKETPAGNDWLSELKLDGYRLLVWLENGKARLVTRNGHDWTDRMPRLAARFAALKVETALLDGEMVALRPDGTSHFHDLQAALSEGRDAALYFYAFDLLHLDGWDLRPCALRDRKSALSGLAGWNDAIRYSEHIEGDPGPLLRQACHLRAEGIICKRADQPYRPGRNAAWLKVKCTGREEFVVLGWTPPGGTRQGLGALAAGFYDANGDLHYVGTVGTGFSDKELLELRGRLEAMASSPPTVLIAGDDPPDRQIRWVRPELVAEVSFTAWSGEGRVRHPVYLGLRDDKAPREVVMAVPDPEAPRRAYRPTAPAQGPRAPSRWKGAIPPLRRTG